VSVVKMSMDDFIINLPEIGENRLRDRETERQTGRQRDRNTDIQKEIERK
jgi:hypothetical protein